jgi:HD-GYP domain-containing protein (c-di-GMP phosphodiesterase class II)
MLASDRITQPTGIRRAELMAALSIATDLGMGQPMEHAMTTCIVAVRLGEAAGLSEDELRDTYYEALLRYIGCNADTYWLASIVGDELALRADLAPIDTADTGRIVALIMRHIRDVRFGASLPQLMRSFFLGLSELPQFGASFFPGHCEVARRLAERLGFSESFVHAVGQLYARWDGKGVPALKGEAIAPALLVASLAQDAVIFYRMGGVEAASAMARERSGGAHSPRLVEIFCSQAAHLLAGLDAEPAWDAVLALEPGAPAMLSEGELDTACQAIADFTDIKGPSFLNHSRRVAELAAAAAERCGLPAGDGVSVRRAALRHDIGKVGLSAGIWEKPGPLSQREWEQVRMHPYYAERILARPAELARLGALAALHHERLDGSGYFRQLPAAMLSPAARILATANYYCALTEARPYRPPAPPEAAAAALHDAVRAGRLDGEVVRGVLGAAGHRMAAARADLVAGLSEREVEVLRLLARGHTTRQVAEQLVISAKTADRHIQNLYAKIGVSTRAAATLFAMEHNLLA